MEKKSKSAGKTGMGSAWSRQGWGVKFSHGSAARTAAVVPASEEPSESETRAVAVLGGGVADKGLAGLAEGALSALGKEGGVVTESGMARVAAAVKFLAVLLGGGRCGAAMKASGLTWAEANTFMAVSEDFKAMYEAARVGQKRAMGTRVLDAAYELAVDGEDVYDRDGKVVGRRKSEKMLDRLLVLDGKEFTKGGPAFVAGLKGGGEAGAGTITLNFHFDGKREGGDSVKETITVDGGAVASGR